MYHCLAVSSCDRPHSSAGIVPGGGLYKMVSTNFSKFLRFITVPNADAVKRGLLSCYHRLLRDASWSTVSLASSVACSTVTCKDVKYSLQISRSSS